MNKLISTFCRSLYTAPTKISYQDLQAKVASWSNNQSQILKPDNSTFLLDVRYASKFKNGSIPGAINIPRILHLQLTTRFPNR